MHVAAENVCIADRFGVDFFWIVGGELEGVSPMLSVVVLGVALGVLQATLRANPVGNKHSATIGLDKTRDN